MDEAKRVLEMIEQGQITAAEGMALLDALKNTEETKADVNYATPVSSEGKKVYQFLRVRVVSENDDTKVKVNIPLSLVKALGSMTSLNQFIPDSAKNDVSGVNFKNIDMDQILDAIEAGTMGDGMIVDVETYDEHNQKIWVKVYVD